MCELPFAFRLSFVLHSLVLLWAVATLLLRRPPPPSLTNAVVVPAGSMVVLRSEHVLQPETRAALRRMAAGWKESHGVSAVLLEGPGWKADVTGAK